MAYCSASDVAALTMSITAPEDNFTFSTCPAFNRVNAWMSSGCGTIETHLGSQGYSMPPATGTAIYDMLRNLNALYAAAYVELSRVNTTITPDERSRGQVYLEMFWDEIKRMDEMDLTRIGLSKASTGEGVLYAGGISVADKQLIEANTDRVIPRFSRGMFKTPGTIDPAGTTAS